MALLLAAAGTSGGPTLLTSRSVLEERGLKPHEAGCEAGGEASLQRAPDSCQGGEAKGEARTPEPPCSEATVEETFAGEAPAQEEVDEAAAEALVLEPPCSEATVPETFAAALVVGPAEADDSEADEEATVLETFTAALGAGPAEVDDSDEEEVGAADESRSIEERRVAEKKAARDQAFWTAAQLAVRERERLVVVGAFLKAEGFSGVHARRGWWSYTYPLHVAAERGHASLVQLLLDSRAVRRRVDASGRTARQVAKAVNTKGSHDAVIEVLKYSQHERRRAAAEAAATAAEVTSAAFARRAAAASPRPGASTSSSVPALAAATPESASANLPSATVLGAQERQGSAARMME